MSDVQDDVPVNPHRKVRLLRVPQFLAQQWNSAASSESIVGVLLRSDLTNPKGLSPNFERGGSAITNTSNSPESGESDSVNKSTRGRQLENGIVIISAAAVASCAASSSSISRLPHKPAAAAAQQTQVQALGNLKALKTQSSSMSHTVLMTSRTHDNVMSNTRPQVLHGHSSARELFLDQDTLAIRLNRGKPSTVTQGIAAEAEIVSTVTLVPSLDKTYQRYLRGRHDMVCQAGRATKENVQPGSSGFDHISSSSHDLSDPARLFRYYRGRGDGEMDDDEDDEDFDRPNEKRRRVKQKAAASRGAESTDSSRDDGLKQRLFQAFEAKAITGDTSGITMKDLITMTGESPNFLKGVLSQIADVVRNGERRRVAYQLKPEFDSKRSSFS